MKERHKTGLLSGASRLDFLLSLALALMAGVVVFVSTHAGMGISSDSQFYLEAAGKTLASGWKQSLDPTGHFPPFYPWSLAMMGALAGDIETGARVLHVLCAILTCYCLCRICTNAIPEYAHDGWFRAILGMAVVTLILGDDFIRLFALVLSEALFVMLVVAAGRLMQRAQFEGRRTWLLGAGLLLGLAALTRHAGLFMLPPALLWVHLSSTNKSKWQASAVFTLSMIFPVLLTKIFFVSAGSRSPALHWPDALHWNEFGQTVAAWFVPYKLALPIVGWIILPSLILAYGTSLRHWLIKMPPRSTKSPDIAIWAMGSALFYLSMLFVTVTVLDFDTPLDYRLLFPIHVLFVGYLVIELTRYMAANINRRLIITIGLFLWCGSQSIKGLNTLRVIGMRENALRASSAIDYLRRIPQTVQLVSNKPEVILQLLSRPCVLLPQKAHRMTMKVNEMLDDEMRSLVAEMKQGKTLLVWIHESQRVYLPTLTDFEKYAALERLPASDAKIALYKVR